MTHLECEELEKSFRHKKVVDSAHVEVRGGSCWTAGTNGAGKTTIFYMIVGLLSRIEEESI
jgi:lipopolysaccharide export system ATP-binding protein